VGFLGAVLLVAVGGSSGAAAPGEQQLTLTLTEFRFVPAQVAVRSGVPVQIQLVNRGAVEHEFMVFEKPKAGAMSMDLHEWARERSYFLRANPRVEGAGVDVERRGKDVVMVMLPPGKSATFRFTPKKTGTFEIGCLVPGHYEAGMKGTFTVR
jgi:uncharacterized cupredoxin-like copper-binding protein